MKKSKTVRLSLNKETLSLLDEKQGWKVQGGGTGLLYNNSGNSLCTICGGCTAWPC